MERADVLVVGGGIAGLASAFWLARRSRQRVLLLERESGYGHHASGANAAILRTFGADPLLNSIARSGAEFLRRPPRDCSEVPLLDPCGLVLGASGEAALGLRRVLEREGAAARARVLARADLGARAPHLAASPELALHFEQDGRIDIAALLAGLAAGARRAGAELRTGAEVRALLHEGTRVSGVRLADGSELGAPLTVLAAGGWAGRLARSAGSRVALQPTRRHLLATGVLPEVDPRWPVLWLEDEGFYCRPESGGLLACACDQDPIDPDRCFPDPAVREEIARKMLHLLRGVERASAARTWCSVRTLSSDGRFALGPDPDLGGLFWVAGLGGHGMSAGAEIGRLAAALIAGEPVDRALRRALDPARLARAAPVKL